MCGRWGGIMCRRQARQAHEYSMVVCGTRVMELSLAQHVLVHVKCSERGTCSQEDISMHTVHVRYIFPHGQCPVSKSSNGIESMRARPCACGLMPAP